MESPPVLDLGSHFPHFAHEVCYVQQPTKQQLQHFEQIGCSRRRSSLSPDISKSQPPSIHQDGQFQQPARHRSSSVSPAFSNTQTPTISATRQTQEPARNRSSSAPGGFQSQNWRQIDKSHELPRRRSETSLQKVHTPLSDKNAAIGSIVFLQPRDSASASPPCTHADCLHVIENAAYNHPAVVLCIWDERPKNGELMALCCTISSNPHPSKDHPQSVPISRNNGDSTTSPYCFPNNHSDDIMHLEQSGSMVKQSYILNSHVYEIPFSKLRPFNVHHPFANRLTERSYNTLVDSVSLPRSSWVETHFLEAGGRHPIDTGLSNDDRIMELMLKLSLFET